MDELRDDARAWLALAPMQKAKYSAALLSVCAVLWAASWVAAAYL